VSLPPAVIAFARLLPERTLLLSRDGAIVFANGAARDALGLPVDDSRLTLASVTMESPEKIEEYLSMWARASELVAGALRVRARGKAEPVTYRCLGGLLTSQADASETLLLCRLELCQLEPEGGSHPLIKDEFLSAASHELRTPLNGILGWTLLLREGMPEDKRTKALDTIERSTRVEVQLIEELLDVSRIVTGTLRLRVQEFDPAHVVKDALEAVRPAAEAKELRVHSALDPDAGPIAGDPARFQQVVRHVLSNAVKFTPARGSVEVSLERTDAGIALTVTDTGIGVSAALLPFVFDRFRQAEGGTSRVRSGPGLGLGLTVAKAIVEMHGGTIHLHSDGEGKGSTFTVRLPRALIVSTV
jgi:signal transduction histidine kinase